MLLMGTGIYLMLSERLHENLDHALKTRTEQLVGFRDIMAIVGGGTFEEKPGEVESFYYYSGGGLKDISQKGRSVPVHKTWIDWVLAEERGFITINTEKEGPPRIYAMPCRKRAGSGSIR